MTNNVRMASKPQVKLILSCPLEPYTHLYRVFHSQDNLDRGIYWTNTIASGDVGPFSL